MRKDRSVQVFSIVFAALFCFFNVSSVQAQSGQWAIKMFSELGTERVHDFGGVALHATAEKRFQFKNIYKEDVVISAVSSNCGCTKASASKNVIHPNEIAEIITRIDTSGEHTKQRKATIRVMFSKPSVAEVQLQVRTYIRPDVGFEPGEIEFGAVQHGQSVVKTVYLQYAGKPDWALIGLQKTNPGIRAEAREVKRENGSVVYEIQVELKPNAQPGYIKDLLKLQTNELDRTTASLFLPIHGLVVEPLSAKPSHMQLGIVSQTHEITKNIVVSGSEPFRIVDVSSSDTRLSFMKTNLARSVHVVPVTFKAGENEGDVSADIVISTTRSKSSKNVQKILVPVSGFIVDDKVSNTDIPVSITNASIKKSTEKRIAKEEERKKLSSKSSFVSVTVEENIVNDGWTPIPQGDSHSEPHGQLWTSVSPEADLNQGWQRGEPFEVNIPKSKMTTILRTEKVAQVSNEESPSIRASIK